MDPRREGLEHTKTIFVRALLLVCFVRQFIVPGTSMIYVKLTRFCGHVPHECQVLARRKKNSSVVAAEEEETDDPSERTAYLPGVLAMIFDGYVIVGLFIHPWPCDEVPGILLHDSDFPRKAFWGALSVIPIATLMHRKNYSH